MSGALFFALGAVSGAAATIAIVLRRGHRPSRPFGPRVPDDALGSDTANNLAAELAGESTFEPLASLLIERCAARVGLPTALVMREKPGAAAAIAAVAGGLDGRLLGVAVPLDSPAGRAMTEGIPIVSAPDEKVVEFDRGDRRRVHSGGVSVPVGQGGRVFGAVVAFGAPAAGGQDAVAGIAQEVKKFAPVIIPAYAAAVAARRAETDELTQLANRRALNNAIARMGPSDRVAVIVLDLDHFKVINDTHGHQAGDAALRHVAGLLREAVRPRDTAARIGGEEFALWLPGADLDGAREVAERVRESVAAAPFRFGGQPHPLTVSCGVAACPKPIGRVENLMGAADTALYTAKHNGRNRVVASMEHHG